MPYRTLSVWGAIALLGWGVFVFLAGRHEAGFPMHYHWDEMGKAAQIQEDRRNLRHPLFILNTTELCIDLFSSKPTAPLEETGNPRRVPAGAMNYNQVTHWGRALSALWVALAVGCLALLAFRQGGWVAAVLTAGLTGLSLPAVEAAHIFKEHGALLLGLSVVLLGLDAYAEKRTARRAFAMGLALGLAFSTKYGAAIVLPFWFWALFLAPAPESKAVRNGLLSLAGVVLAFGVINFHPAWFDGQSLFNEPGHREWTMLFSGHHGSGISVPHLFFWKRFWEIHPSPYFFAALTAPLLWMLWVARMPGERSSQLFRASLTALGLLNLLALGLVRKLSPEYLWPTLFFMGLPIALLAGRMICGGWSNRRSAWSLAGVGLAGVAVMLLLGSEFRSWKVLLQGYHADARRELIQFIKDTVPADAIIAEDHFVGLASPGDVFLIEVEKELPHPVLSDYFIADRGTVAELRARGVRYVAINMDQAVHYLDFDLIDPRSKGQFDRRRTFYRDLQEGAELVWESPRGRPIQMRPWLRIYRVGDGLTTNGH